MAVKQRHLFVFLMLLGGGQAHAHFAPSPTQNNRYAKLTLLPDTVRVSYTVYFGDRPGQLERERMDGNHDGVISDAEAASFGASIVGEIGPQIFVEVDGKPAAAPWTVADVGLGTPTTSAGSFSVDLLMKAPVSDPSRTSHAIYLEDRWPAPSPGENEVRVEESPGVRVVEAHLRRDGTGAQLRFAFTGGTEDPVERGIMVRYTVDPSLTHAAPPPSAPETPAAAAKARAASRLPYILGGILSAVMVAILIVRRRLKA